MSTDSVQHRILIIEDDPKVATILSAKMVSEGYEVRVAHSGEEGFYLMYSFHPDLLVLDLALPGRGGLEVLRLIRKQSQDVRVLILTSYNDVEDRVIGFKAGADDYLGKPFSITELLARVAALLRRGQVISVAPTLHVADLVLEVSARIARRSGVELVLTLREFDLLLYLTENQGRAVSREMLSRDVWRETSRFTPIDNVIDVQIARLRRKVDDPFSMKLLHTIRGVGFMIREPKP